MIGIEQDDGLRPPELADAYGPAVTFVCEGSTRLPWQEQNHERLLEEGFCPRQIYWGHLLPEYGPGIWGFMCKKHGAVCRRVHPNHLVKVAWP